MTNRREFITAGAAALALASNPFLKRMSWSAHAAEALAGHWQLPVNFGLGGVAIGNAFKPTSDKDAMGALEGAWKSGVRYFDTSPFYGYGLSERRFGAFLDDKPRDQFTVSTKVGRVFTASDDPRKGLWVNPSKFDYEYDYTAAGVRRSIEDSLQRLGLSHIDIAFIHDLSPDNKDFNGEWKKYFDIAKDGAMKELSKMKKEGIIKAWGLGVNEIDPVVMALDVADPDIILSATQYSLMKHEDAIKRMFPVVAKRNAKLVIGAPLNAGFLAGVDRYDYEGKFPDNVKERRAKMMEVCKEHKVDLRTAALQFSLAPEVVAAVIPGSRNMKQAEENSRSMQKKIPSDFWKDLKAKGLISKEAAEPREKFA